MGTTMTPPMNRGPHFSHAPSFAPSSLRKLSLSGSGPQVPSSNSESFSSLLDLVKPSSSRKPSIAEPQQSTINLSPRDPKEGSLVKKRRLSSLGITAAPASFLTADDPLEYLEKQEPIISGVNLLWKRICSSLDQVDIVRPLIEQTKFKWRFENHIGFSIETSETAIHIKEASHSKRAELANKASKYFASLTIIYVGEDECNREELSKFLTEKGVELFEEGDFLTFQTHLAIYKHPNNKMVMISPHKGKAEAFKSLVVKWVLSQRPKFEEVLIPFEKLEEFEGFEHLDKIKNGVKESKMFSGSILRKTGIKTIKVDKEGFIIGHAAEQSKETIVDSVIKFFSNLKFELCHVGFLEKDLVLKSTLSHFGYTEINESCACVEDCLVAKTNTRHVVIASNKEMIDMVARHLSRAVDAGQEPIQINLSEEHEKRLKEGKGSCDFKQLALFLDSKSFMISFCVTLARWLGLPSDAIYVRPTTGVDGQYTLHMTISASNLPPESVIRDIVFKLLLESHQTNVAWPFETEAFLAPMRDQVYANDCLEEDNICLEKDEGSPHYLPAVYMARKSTLLSCRIICNKIYIIAFERPQFDHLLSTIERIGQLINDETFKNEVSFKSIKSISVEIERFALNLPEFSKLELPMQAIRLGFQRSRQFRSVFGDMLSSKVFNLFDEDMDETNVRCIGTRLDISWKNGVQLNSVLLGLISSLISCFATSDLCDNVEQETLVKNAISKTIPSARVNVQKNSESDSEEGVTLFEGDEIYVIINNLTINIISVTSINHMIALKNTVLGCLGRPLAPLVKMPPQGYYNKKKKRGNRRGNNNNNNNNYNNNNSNSRRRNNNNRNHHNNNNNYNNSNNRRANSNNYHNNNNNNNNNNRNYTNNNTHNNGVIKTNNPTMNARRRAKQQQQQQQFSNKRPNVPSIVPQQVSVPSKSKPKPVESVSIIEMIPGSKKKETNKKNSKTNKNKKKNNNLNNGLIIVEKSTKNSLKTE
eukprot:TRINITY_DN323_c5_g1_i1.p1 TRINITY_DN323_c5_g1~~TRINITY_DN323_c5_g1_i1.p1  ORF type:complete len:1133 (-),score=381.28 TRINITY_DN323_c5_g1_i1:157-3120(-)